MSKRADRIVSQTRLALELTEEFKFDVSKQLIQSWQRQWNPPFPTARADGSYSRKAACAWVKKHYVKSPAQSELLIDAFNAKSRLEIAKAKQAEFDLELQAGKFISREKSDRDLFGAMSMYHVLTRRLVETYHPDSRRDKLQQLGVSHDVIAVFHDFDLKESQKLIDRLERERDELGKPT